eukprot:1627519-Rhodomonas_salina.1
MASLSRRDSPLLQTAVRTKSEVNCHACSVCDLPCWRPAGCWRLGTDTQSIPGAILLLFLLLITSFFCLAIILARHAGIIHWEYHPEQGSFKKRQLVHRQLPRACVRAT